MIDKFFCSVVMEEGRFAMYANVYDVHVIYLIKIDYAILDIGIPNHMTIVIRNLIDCRKHFMFASTPIFSATIFPNVI